MRIEPARPADMPAVWALARASGLGGQPPLEPNPAARVWVAHDEAGSVIGLLHAWEVADELQIQDLAVHANCRRRGIARALLMEAITFARTSGKRLIVLEVRSSNDPAISLYLTHGFRIAGRRTAYYRDGETALAMQLSLDGPAVGMGG